ncbi:MAG: MarR family transcriptional regulator [Marinilabiliales bacterium]|nr:MAG: MarR family transcriptional regulator [Marinilabiliales bacterium]
MKSLNIVSELIEYIKKYEEENGKSPADLQDFISWINGLVFTDDHTAAPENHDLSIDMELTFLLMMQNKHYKNYCKEALSHSEINSPDEYSFLYHLTLVDSFRKMELIHLHLLEAPSGIEVIKRLLKKGFIEEFDDEEDKRAKRIRITPKGRLETETLIPKMNQVYSKMAADLTAQEKVHLVAFLKRFNSFHLGSH